MNFGEILNKWEKQTSTNRVFDKDAFDETAGTDKRYLGERRFRLLRKKADARIDLHGLKSDEAWDALKFFFESSRNNGFEKILVIHGKGNHSGEGILKELTKRFIESCSYAGESGFNSAREGGTGATWVILKERNEEQRLSKP